VAAVELAHQLGLRAVRSRHLEPVLNRWLLSVPDAPRSRWWKRLESLPWGATLSPQQLGNFVERASGLSLRAHAAGDRDLRSVAIGLNSAMVCRTVFPEQLSHSYSHNSERRFQMCSRNFEMAVEL
jgi:hypothetical protein